MDSIKLKFRASSKPGKHGVLFFQIIHDRTVRRVTIGHRIFSGEWCDDSETILLPDSASNRYAHVKAVMQHCEWEIERFTLYPRHSGQEIILLKNLWMPSGRIVTMGKVSLSFCKGKVPN